jgi:hypothetical protein
MIENNVYDKFLIENLKGKILKRNLPKSDGYVYYQFINDNSVISRFYVFRPHSRKEIKFDTQCFSDNYLHEKLKGMVLINETDKEYCDKFEREKIKYILKHGTFKSR